MKITCQGCEKTYNIEDKKIPTNASSLKCKKCGTRIPLKKTVSKTSGNENRKEKSGKASVAEPGTRIIECPNCKREYKFFEDKMPGVPAIKCRSCGKNIPLDVGVSGKTCKKCGYSRNALDDSISSPDFCPKCGLKYVRYESYANRKNDWQKEQEEKSRFLLENEAPPPQTGKYLMFSFAAVVGLVIIVAGFNFVKDLIPTGAEGDMPKDFVVAEEKIPQIQIPVFSGLSHTVVVKNDGTAWSWGSNEYGQLGNGTLEDTDEPEMIDEPGKIVAVSGGPRFTLALKDDGTVWAWGYNGNGELGDGTRENRSSPVRVSGLEDMVAVSGGGFHSLALKRDGTVWAWGRDSYGQTGNMGQTGPAMIPNFGGVVAIAAGDLHSVALMHDGTVRSWGSNNRGQLGTGKAIRESMTPLQVQGLTGAISISAGGSSSFAVKNDGTAVAWGSNIKGKLGDNTMKDRRSPSPVADLAGIRSLAAGSLHTIALLDDGTVWAWGENRFGQLGIGGGKIRKRPVRTHNLEDIGFIAVSYKANLALKSSGIAWTWGNNRNGQIGGDARIIMTPARTTFYTGMRQVANESEESP